MKEYWINVYMINGNKYCLGSKAVNMLVANFMARQAKGNGAKLLYRIHVRMK